MSLQFNSDNLVPVAFKDIKVGDVLTIYESYDTYPATWTPAITITHHEGERVLCNGRPYYKSKCLFFRKKPSLPTTQGSYIILDELHLEEFEMQVEPGTVAMLDADEGKWDFFEKGGSYHCVVKPEKIARWRPLDTK